MGAPHFSEADRERIHREVDVILDVALSMGPNVNAFEQEFAKEVGVKHAIAMNSCSSALEVALMSLGIDFGDEVIVPVETFIATGMAVHLTGGIPVFAEISESTFCLDLNDVKQRITEKTKGIILVHMAGFITPDIEDFRTYCDMNNLFLIEDAAHAPGARLAGRAAGSIGHIGCFSFYPTKVITAGEGGMLTTDDDTVAAYARSLQHRGKDLDSNVEQYSLPGRNIRMTEMAALLGRVQLSHLDEFLSKRHRVAEVYKRILSDEQLIMLVLPDEITASSCWKIPVLLDSSIDRVEITEKMSARGVSVDWAYQPALHLQPVFRTLYGTKEGQLPRSENLLSRHICLPCHPQMSENDAVYVAETLKSCIKH